MGLVRVFFVLVLVDVHFVFPFCVSWFGQASIYVPSCFILGGQFVQLTPCFVAVILSRVLFC